MFKRKRISVMIKRKYNNDPEKNKQLKRDDHKKESIKKYKKKYVENQISNITYQKQGIRKTLT